MEIPPAMQKVPSEIEKFIEMYGDLAILPPVRIPSEIAYVTSGEWSDLLTGIRNERFETVLLLFDRSALQLSRCYWNVIINSCRQAGRLLSKSRREIVNVSQGGNGKRLQNRFIYQLW